MKFSHIILAAASASCAVAKYIRCGTPDVNSTHMAEMNAVVKAADARVMAAAAVSVDVYVPNQSTDCIEHFSSFLPTALCPRGCC